MKASPRTLILKSAPIYEQSPFMDKGNLRNLPKTTRQMQAPKRAAVFEPATGQQIGECDGFYRKTEVDATQHIKLYLEGIGALSRLSKPGLAVFQTLYCQMLKHVAKDKVAMTPQIAKKLRNISQSVYFAGMTQLIEAGFIAKSDETPFYWINPAYIFNGNRLRFVQDYDLKEDREEETTASLIQMTATIERKNPPNQIDVEDYIESQQDQDATASERGDAAAQSEQSTSQTGEARKAKKAPQRRLKAAS